MMPKPYLINFDSIGDPSLGYISVGQAHDKIPFDIKRVYWTYYTPQAVKRGGHANINKELVLISVAGSIIIDIELQDRSKYNFKLESPNEGLYIPKLSWHTMQYSHNAVQVVLASNDYSESDYIRNYEVFKLSNK